MSQQIFPLAVWQSGTNENSIPANDNALRVEVLMGPAISVADSEPAGPADGDQHVIGASWGGFATNNVVVFKGGTWLEWEAFEGWVKVVSGVQSFYDGSAWVAGSGGGGIPEAPEDGVIYGRQDGEWVEVPGGPAPSQNYEIITEASAFTAVPATHGGRNRIILAGGDITFNTTGIEVGQCYNIRATGAVTLVGSGVTLTPTDGGTLAMTARMQVTVVMTSGTTGIVMGLTVAP